MARNGLKRSDFKGLELPMDGFEVLETYKRRYSTIYRVRVQPDDLDIMVKRFSYAQGMTSTSRKFNDPSLAHYRETGINKILSEADPSVALKLIPQFLGYNKEHLLYFREWVHGDCHRKKFAAIEKEKFSALQGENTDEVRRVRDKLDEAKMVLVYEAMDMIARFHAYCEQYSANFANRINLEDAPVNQQVRVYAKYLTRLAYFHHFKEIMVKEGKAKGQIRKKLGVNIDKMAGQLIRKGRKAMNDTNEVGIIHGDLNAAHVLDKLIDFEDVRKGKLILDPTRYLIDENTKIPVEQIPFVIAYYEGQKAFYRGELTGEVERVHDVDELARLVNDVIGKENFAQAYVTYLATAIEQTIHIAAVRTKYSPGQINDLLRQCPTYKLQDIHTAQLKRLASNLDFYFGSQGLPIRQGIGRGEKRVTGYLDFIRRLLFNDLQLLKTANDSQWWSWKIFDEEK
ncbi:hypothetical protein ACFLZB_00170 [Nanoarchaeota archaeon]